MKKFMLFLVLMMIPFSAFALDTFSDSDLDEITGQLGGPLMVYSSTLTNLYGYRFDQQTLQFEIRQIDRNTGETLLVDSFGGPGFNLNKFWGNPWNKIIYAQSELTTLHQYNLNSGIISTTATLDTPNLFIDIGKNEVLYGMNWNPDLFHIEIRQIDSLTGTTTLLNSVDVGNVGFYFRGFWVDPESNIGYLLAGTSLYMFDLDSGASHTMITLSTPNLIDIEVGKNGALYGFHVTWPNIGEIVAIDKVTGMTTALYSYNFGIEKGIKTGFWFDPHYNIAYVLVNEAIYGDAEVLYQFGLDAVPSIKKTIMDRDMILLAVTGAVTGNVSCPILCPTNVDSIDGLYEKPNGVQVRLTNMGSYIEKQRDDEGEVHYRAFVWVNDNPSIFRWANQESGRTKEGQLDATTGNINISIYEGCTLIKTKTWTRIGN